MDGNYRLQVLRSTKASSESRCPEARDCLEEDSVSQIQGAVSQGEDMCIMAARTASTAKPKIPGSSLETAVEDVHVPETGNSHALESVGGGSF